MIKVMGVLRVRVAVIMGAQHTPNPNTGISYPEASLTVLAIVSCDLDGEVDILRWSSIVRGLVLERRGQFAIDDLEIAGVAR